MICPQCDNHWAGFKKNESDKERLVLLNSNKIQLCSPDCEANWDYA